MSNLEEKYILDFAFEKQTSRQTIYNAINRGELNSIRKFGNKTFIIIDEKSREWKPKKQYISSIYKK